MVSKKIKDKILNKSDMYNFYKEEYESNSDALADLAGRISALEAENEEKNNILDSYHVLLNTLFCYYDITPKSYLKNVQDLGVEILKFVDNVCAKHDIDYWLDYGTLLGAVRHEGYIPWDDDLDVAMMRADYSRFIRIFTSELKENNLTNLKCDFQQSKFKGKPVGRWTQITYRHPDYKISFMGTDIFPYDYIKTNEISNIDDVFMKSREEFYLANQEKMPFSQVLERYCENMKLSLERQDFYLSGVEGVRSPKDFYRIKILETDRLYPLKTLNFKDHSFKVPSDTDYYLSMIYGDTYREIPKSVRDHSRISKLIKIENINDLLEDAVDEMKSANENF
ncbi:MAG: LicD family protein [Methanobrevibacter sp.]|nr:LicD family protein [Methanobrevibacter sp.]